MYCIKTNIFRLKHAWRICDTQKSYWQQFEATIHNSKKLDNQLRMQYLLKSLVTKRARDAIEGIDAVAEAYPEAIAALKARFDRPQIIYI